MEILEFGKKENKKIILIHGFQSPYQIWEPYIEHYQNDFHVIVPILPGHNPNKKEEFSSLESYAKELEDFYISRYCTEVYAIYGMSMGGVIASCIWKNKKLQIEKLILESSPLLPFGKFMSAILTKQYLEITHKAQQRDPKILRQAVNSMITEEYLDAFLKLLDNISDSTIVNYLNEVYAFKLLPDIDTPDTRLTYYYGGSVNEVPFRSVARYIKKHYPNANIVRLPRKGHCEDALLNPDIWIRELDRILGQ